MPVFISHQKADAEIAKKIYNYLEASKVPCYIDEMDAALRTSKDITNIIMKRIAECTHMLAIVSSNTVSSWWVPFEIGVASKGDRRISTFKFSQITLPQYLTVWPIMTTTEHLKSFVTLYNNDKSVLLEKSAGAMEVYSAQVKTADDFHDKLKKITGQ